MDSLHLIQKSVGRNIMHWRTSKCPWNSNQSIFIFIFVTPHKSQITNHNSQINKSSFEMDRNIIRSYNHWLLNTSLDEVNHQIAELKYLEDSLSRVLLYKLENLHQFLIFKEQQIGRSSNEDNIQTLQEVNICHKSITGIRTRIDAVTLDLELLRLIRLQLQPLDQN